MSNFSNLSRQKIVAKAYQVTHVEFFDGEPNYFRVTNNGSGRLYMSCSRTPSLVNYDFTCDGDSVKLWCEPFARSFLDIYNPTGSDIAVDLMTFYAPFEPLALAFSGIALDFGGAVLETSTAIDSFKTALPAGSNNIGKVTIANAQNYTTALNNILTAVNKSTYSEFYEGQAGSKDSFNAPNGYKINELSFFSNDGSSDIVIGIANVNGTEKTITIKAGEVLNNIRCNTDYISFSGAGNFRICYRITED